MKRTNHNQSIDFQRDKFTEIINLLIILPPECSDIVLRELRICVKLLEGDDQDADIHLEHQSLDMKLAWPELPSAN